MSPGKFLRFTSVLLVISMLAGFLFSGSHGEETLSLYERMYIVSKTYSSIKVYFAHRSAIPNFSLDAVYKDYLRKVIETEYRLSFDLLMMWNL